MKNLVFSITLNNHTFNVRTNHMTTLCSYDIKDKYTTSLVFATNTYAYVNYARMITFTPSQSGYYDIETTGNINSFIYVIDPGSNVALVANQDYNNNSGTALNARLIKYLDAGVPYLIVYSAANPATLPATTEMTITCSLYQG